VSETMNRTKIREASRRGVIGVTGALLSCRTIAPGLLGGVCDEISASNHSTSRGLGHSDIGSWL
jgi:hypothetical protein